MPADSTVRVARNLVNAEKYSRLPVYRETMDNFEGMVYVRDLLQAAYQAVEASGYFAEPAPEADVGCYVGVATTDYHDNIASHRWRSYCGAA